jgi:hypothetical protein
VAEDYGIEADKFEDEFTRKGFAAKSGTVRRWLN